MAQQRASMVAQTFVVSGSTTLAPPGSIVKLTELDGSTAVTDCYGVATGGSPLAAAAITLDANSNFQQGPSSAPVPYYLATPRQVLGQVGSGAKVALDAFVHAPTYQDVPGSDPSTPVTATLTASANLVMGQLNRFSCGRRVTDGVTNSTTTFTSQTAAFVAGDVGKTVLAPGVPANTTISSVTNATTIVLSAAATATATGLTTDIGANLTATAVSPTGTAATLNQVETTVKKTDPTAFLVNITGNINGTANSTLPLRYQEQAKTIVWSTTDSTFVPQGGDLSLTTQLTLFARALKSVINGWVSGTNYPNTQMTILSDAGGIYIDLIGDVPGAAGATVRPSADTTGRWRLLGGIPQTKITSGPLAASSSAATPTTPTDIPGATVQLPASSTSRSVDLEFYIASIQSNTGGGWALQAVVISSASGSTASSTTSFAPTNLPISTVSSLTVPRFPLTIPANTVPTIVKLQYSAAGAVANSNLGGGIVNVYDSLTAAA